MSAHAPLWRTVYTATETQFDNQYVPLLTGPQTEKKLVNFVDELVDINSTTQRIRLLLDFAKSGFTNAEHDLLDQLSIDQLEQDAVRIRPLSYEFHKNFHAALDQRSVMKAGVTEKFKTLREELSEHGRPHQLNSDIAPSKLGVCALLMDWKDGKPRFVETVRAKNLAIFPDTRHASFSGGVERQDLTNESQTLSDLIARAAVRECKEEIGIDVPTSCVTVLGAWREMERCSVQTFAIAEVSDLEAVEFSLDPKELQSCRIRPLAEGLLKNPFGRAKSAELEFLEKLLETMKLQPSGQ